MNGFLRGKKMAMLTVRNLPDDVHRALKAMALKHGQSTEAEVREILAKAVKPEARVRLGDELSKLGCSIGFSDEDIELLEKVRDKEVAEPLEFK